MSINAFVSKVAAAAAMAALEANGQCPPSYPLEGEVHA